MEKKVNFLKIWIMHVTVDISSIGSLFNSMYNKLWDQFSRGWNLVFWPPQVQESYTERSILRNERSECKQGEARYTILERVEVQKLNFTRDYWSHSELYILLNFKDSALFDSKHILKKKLKKNTKFWVKSLKNCSSILFFKDWLTFDPFSKQNRVVWSENNKAR